MWSASTGRSVPTEQELREMYAAHRKVREQIAELETLENDMMHDIMDARLRINPSDAGARKFFAGEG